MDLHSSKLTENLWNEPFVFLNLGAKLDFHDESNPSNQM